MIAKLSVYISNGVKVVEHESERLHCREQDVLDRLSPCGEVDSGEFADNDRVRHVQQRQLCDTGHLTPSLHPIRHADLSRHDHRLFLST